MFGPACERGFNKIIYKYINCCVISINARVCVLCAGQWTRRETLIGVTDLWHCGRLTPLCSWNVGNYYYCIGAYKIGFKVWSQMWAYIYIYKWYIGWLLLYGQVPCWNNVWAIVCNSYSMLPYLLVLLYLFCRNNFFSNVLANK